MPLCQGSGGRGWAGPELPVGGGLPRSGVQAAQGGSCGVGSIGRTPLCSWSPGAVLPSPLVSPQILGLTFAMTMYCQVVKADAYCA